MITTCVSKEWEHYWENIYPDSVIRYITITREFHKQDCLTTVKHRIKHDGTCCCRKITDHMECYGLKRSRVTVTTLKWFIFLKKHISKSLTRNKYHSNFCERLGTFLVSLMLQQLLTVVPLQAPQFFSIEANKTKRGFINLELSGCRSVYTLFFK